MMFALSIYLSMGFTLHHGDCLEVMPTIADRSVDMILADLPYGTTQSQWDSVIPFHRLWPQYKRIIKPNGAIVLTASQPFTSALVMSNPDWFGYSLTWKKTKKTGFLNAQRQPLRQHEDVLVFYGSAPTYNPQGTRPCNKIVDRGSPEGTGDCYGNANPVYLQTVENYPTSVIEIDSEGPTVHPTQKPVALMEYLIRTYTNPGETVLDNTMGVGTTIVAAMNTDRHGIGIERDPEYFRIAETRIKAAAIGDTKPAIAKSGKPAPVQPSLFSLITEGAPA